MRKIKCSNFEKSAYLLFWNIIKIQNPIVGNKIIILLDTTHIEYSIQKNENEPMWWINKSMKSMICSSKCKKWKGTKPRWKDD